MAAIECICTLLVQFEKFTAMSVVPELLILHIGHVIIISIAKCFYDASAISLLVLSYADDTINDCEDDKNGGRYDLQLGLAFQLANRRRRY